MVNITISRRSAFVIILALLLVVPAAAFAGSLFDDVEDTNVHFPGIEFMKNSGVTLGCGDGTVYCPNDPVTRAQMATFMLRLSGNDAGTPPSVNADTLDGLDSTDVYTKTEIDASRTVTVPHSHWDMWWAGATAASTVNNCQRRPFSSGVDPGRLALTALPVGATVVSGTAYAFDPSAGAATYTLSWRLNSTDFGLDSEFLDSVTDGGDALSFDTHVFELDPPIVIEPGDSMFITFSSGADRHGFCGFDLTYVLPDI